MNILFYVVVELTKRMLLDGSSRPELSALTHIPSVPGTPASLSWCWNAGEAVAFAPRRGPLLIWTISGPDSGVTMHRDAHSFMSDICTFRWHSQKKGKVVFGHMDGSLSIFQPGEDVLRAPTFSFP